MDYEMVDVCKDESAKPAKRFLFGGMCLWCMLSLVLFFVFYLLYYYIRFSNSNINIPVFVDPMQYIWFSFQDALFWKALLSPLLCILFVQAAAFLLGRYRLIKSPAVCLLLMASGILLSVLHYIYLKNLSFEGGIFSFQSLWDKISACIIFSAAPAVFAGLISLPLYTMASSASTGSAKHRLKRFVLSFAGCSIPPLFMVLALN